MAVYKGKPEQGQRTVRTMIGVLVPVLLLTAGQAMAQLTSEGNQIWHQDSDGIAGRAELRDNFGDALAAGDFNNDGFEDLAIGVAREDVGGEENAGAVNVIYGGPEGLAPPGNQIWAPSTATTLSGGPEGATTLVERLPPVTSTAISSKT